MLSSVEFCCISHWEQFLCSVASSRTWPPTLGESIGSNCQLHGFHAVVPLDASLCLNKAYYTQRNQALCITKHPRYRWDCPVNTPCRREELLSGSSCSASVVISVQRMIVCSRETLSTEWASCEYVCQYCSWSAEQGKWNIPCSRSRLRVWLRPASTRSYSPHPGRICMGCLLTGFYSSFPLSATAS